MNKNQESKLYFSAPGVVCAAGNNAESLWKSCLCGNQSGIKKVSAISKKEFFVGKIDDDFINSPLLNFPQNAKYDMRITRILNAALEQIKPQVEFVKKRFGASRIGVCLGSCDNGSEFSFLGHRAFFENGAFPENYELDVQSADYPATFAREKFGLTGPSFVFSTACSSSASAIIKAKELILAGIIDAAIVGGVDVASDTVLLGFDSLEAVSDEVTNPFSKNRKGITLGEGAAVFVLSKENCFGSENENYKNSAVEAKCDNEECEENDAFLFLGSGESSDAHHITAPLADGSGAARAIKSALSDANLEAKNIDYLNLHGTGTVLNDSMESKAVRAIFGDYCEALPVSSTKPLMGHTLGASGAIELAICYMALKNSVCKKLPIHVFDGALDENLPKMNFVKDGFLSEKEIKIAMSNSFGFGGCNISLIIGKVGK